MFQFILLKLICEGIRVFLKIILNQLKFFSFLYKIDKNNYFVHFKKDLFLSYIKSIQFVKFFLLKQRQFIKKILFFSYFQYQSNKCEKNISFSFSYFDIKARMKPRIKREEFGVFGKIKNEYIETFWHSYKNKIIRNIRALKKNRCIRAIF